MRHKFDNVNLSELISTNRAIIEQIKIFSIFIFFYIIKVVQNI